MNRLREFDEVVISLPLDTKSRIGCFDCQVAGIAGIVAALVPLNRSDANWLPERSENAMLSFRHRDTLVSLKGTLSTRDSVDDLRFVLTDHGHVPRRRSSRVKLAAPVALTRTSNGTIAQAVTVDVGLEGMLVATDLSCDVGERLEVVLSLPGADEAVECSARVVRQGQGMLALELAGTSREDRRRLGATIFRTNRDAIFVRRYMLASLEGDEPGF